VASAVAAGDHSGRDLAVLALATLAAGSGAGSLNHWLDRDLDARMPRTRTRPLPDGRLSPSVALGLGLLLVLIGASTATTALGPGAAAYLLAGAATYVVVYTGWLKPRTPFSIVWGGAAGSFAALAGWQTAASTLAPAPLVLAGVLFLWTPSHFWSFAIARETDYAYGGVPTLVAVAGPARAARAAATSAAGLVLWSWLLCAFLSWPYALVVFPAGIWFLRLACALARDPSPERAWRVFKLSGIHLLVVLVGLAAAGLA
ncbi:MAG TPA: protoheme IX farnesyltransferase, partial [Gaiellaceae bacterium]|nr:protoheme IX farnesyltransferase [Gaiellaceae bacterium]